MKNPKPKIHSRKLQPEYSVRWYSIVQIAWIEFERYIDVEEAHTMASVLKSRLSTAGEAPRVVIVKITEEEVKG